MIFIQIIVILVVLGIVWYFLSPYIGEPFRTMVIVVAVLAFCLWLLKQSHIFSF